MADFTTMEELIRLCATSTARVAELEAELAEVRRALRKGSCVLCAGVGYDKFLDHCICQDTLTPIKP